MLSNVSRFYMGQAGIAKTSGCFAPRSRVLLDAEHRDLWLQQLLIQFDQASVDDLIALQQRYLALQSVRFRHDHTQ